MDRPLVTTDHRQIVGHCCRCAVVQNRAAIHGLPVVQANPTINALGVIGNGLGLTVFELFDRVREQMPVPRKQKKAKAGS